MILILICILINHFKLEGEDLCLAVIGQHLVDLINFSNSTNLIPTWHEKILTGWIQGSVKDETKSTGL